MTSNGVTGKRKLRDAVLNLRNLILLRESRVTTKLFVRRFVRYVFLHSVDRK